MPAKRSKQAVTYTVKMLCQLALCALTFFLAAGRWYVPRGIVYFAVYLIISVIGNAFLLRCNSETLAARERVAPNTKCWDTVFLFMYVPLAYFGIYIAAGLPLRIGDTYPPVTLYWIGICMMVSASFLTVWAVHVNRHFESSVRIQRDRHHVVCSTGPYAIVRHPGYTSIIVWAVAMPLMFGWHAGIVSIAIIVLITIRTMLEDAVLQRELHGYKEYSEKVPYRLFFLVW